MAVRALLVSAPMKAWLLGLCAVLVLGCQNRGTAPSGKTALQVQLVSAPLTLDPIRFQPGPAFQVLVNVMDGLVGVDSQGLIQPRLASGYQVSEGGKRYTFTLRPEALWSDGRPVLPSEFVEGIRRALDPVKISSWANLLFPIRGARAYHERSGGWESVGVRVEGENQVVFDLEKASPSFLAVLALPVAYPAREGGPSSGVWNDKTPVTGPYVLAFQKGSESILLAPNDYYWGRRVLGKMIARPVMLRVVPNDAEAKSLMSTGLLDIRVAESKPAGAPVKTPVTEALQAFQVRTDWATSARVTRVSSDALGWIHFEDVEVAMNAKSN